MNGTDPCPTRGDRAPLTLSVPEAAKLLGVSRDLVYDLVAQGELPALRLGRRIVLPRRALEELVEAAWASDASREEEDRAELEVVGLTRPQRLTRTSSQS
jgi:excisionase family DNA binding protein